MLLMTNTRFIFSPAFDNRRYERKRAPAARSALVNAIGFLSVISNSKASFETAPANAVDHGSPSDKSAFLLLQHQMIGYEQSAHAAVRAHIRSVLIHINDMDPAAPE